MVDKVADIVSKMELMTELYDKGELDKDVFIEMMQGLGGELKQAKIAESKLNALLESGADGKQMLLFD